MRIPLHPPGPASRLMSCDGIVPPCLTSTLARPVRPSLARCATPWSTRAGPEPPHKIIVGTVAFGGLIVYLTVMFIASKATSGRVIAPSIGHRFRREGDWVDTCKGVAMVAGQCRWNGRETLRAKASLEAAWKPACVARLGLATAVPVRPGQPG